MRLPMSAQILNGESEGRIYVAEEVIRKVRDEFPPLTIDPELAKALASRAACGTRATGVEPVRSLGAVRR
jgi:hypothetical protein